MIKGQKHKRITKNEIKRLGRTNTKQIQIQYERISMTGRQTDIKAFNSKNDGVRYKRKNEREGVKEGESYLLEARHCALKM